MSYYKIKNGFTLVEIIVAVSIVSILGGTVIASINYQRKKARDAVRTQDVKKLTEAIYLYYNDNGDYPVGEDDTLDGQSIDLDLYKNTVLVEPNDASFIPELTAEGYLPRSLRDPNSIEAPLVLGYRYYFGNNNLVNIQTRKVGCGNSPIARAMLTFRFETGLSDKYRKLNPERNAICFY